MNRVGNSARILRQSALRTEKSTFTRMTSVIPTQPSGQNQTSLSPSFTTPSIHFNPSTCYYPTTNSQKMSKFIEKCKSISSAAGKTISTKKLSEFSLSSVSVTFICSMGELALWAVLNLENGLVEFVIDDNNGL
ncbi:Oidioi.mRNA.OKI2018_I69.PAR.g11440.t1.cds [Oikopleura dioica]|uniref:Oidioi.mRNA.OKI2018_I69.PAR.g11440.t1.cds n=1 Tax=Oikopleura dioica TaxID=34765 RepID=A0ABN7S2E5_OIKDI|nr:Oidioi.mRNA.OKI2018_I69.PAR.g11440.t1.cds [Oikopleura dioica]